MFLTICAFYLSQGVCANLAQPYYNDSKVLIHQLSLATQAYFNYSSSYVGSCFDTTAEPDNLGADQGWNFQVCEGGGRDYEYKAMPHIFISAKRKCHTLSVLLLVNLITSHL